MEENFYDVLGITEEEKKLHGEEFTNIVNQKYKAIARKNHPDALIGKSEEERKKGEEIFKKANEAKDVLSDENKRQQYDLGSQGGGDWGGFNPFSHGFGGFDPFGEGFNPFGQRGGQNHGPVAENGTDCQIEVELTLKECFEGCTKEVVYGRYKKCSSCNGTGSADGKETACPHCGGTGFITQSSRKGNMFFQQSTQCPHCHGSGVINEHPCKKCNGSGVESEIVKGVVTFPKGMKDGISLMTNLAGNEGKHGGRDGRLIVTVKVKGDKNFTIRDNNIVYTDKVNLVDALLGYEKEITLPNGENLKVKVDELTRDNHEIVYRGKGLPIIDQYGNTHGNGNLIFIVHHLYPSKLTKKQKTSLEEFKKNLEN